MSWRRTFLRQAASDDAVRRLLDRSGVEPCHRLHYLQMAAEKLAKGLLLRESDTDPPPPTHQALVRLLQVVKNRPDLRRRLGYTDVTSYVAHINSLLPLAARIEALAPSSAGFGRPNPEYPWRDATTGEVRAPVDYEYAEFDWRLPRMRKLSRFIELLAQVSD